jgi:hypothetical protein
MSRIAAYLDIVEGRRTTPLTDDHPADALLRQVLARTAFADGTLDAGEGALLARLFPDEEPAVLARHLGAEAAAPMDYDALLEAFPSDDQREQLVRLAEALAAAHTDREDDEGEAVELAFVDVLRAMVGV